MPLSPQEIMLLLNRGRAPAPDQSAPGIMDELQANPGGWGYDAPQEPDPMSMVPFGEQQTEMRGTGPGESRNFDDYARSGFAGQLEPTLANDVTPVVPGAGATYLASAFGPEAVDTIPRIAADLSGAFAAQADENPLTQLYADRQMLVKRRDEADRERQNQMRTGKGPKHDAAVAAYEEVSNRLSALDQMIQSKEKENSPEHKLEMEAKTAEQARAQKLKDANTSVKELHPDVMPWVPILSMLGAGYLGSKIKGAYVGKFNKKVGDLDAKWGDVTKRGGEALKRGNMKSASQLTDEAKALRDQLDSIQKKGPGGTVPAISAGAALGEAGQLGPMAVDYSRATPGSELYEETTDAMKDPAGVAGRVGTGLMLGGLPSKVTSAVRGAQAVKPAGFKSETEGLENALGAEKAARISAARSASRNKNKALNGGALTAEAQKALPPPKAEFVPGQRADPKSGMSIGELNEKLTDFADAWFSVNKGKNIKSTHILNIAKQNDMDMSLGQATRLARRLNKQYGEKYINAGAKAALTKKE